MHTADVHLERMDGGRAQRAFSAVVDLSIDISADLLLIAGDLFDHSRVRADIVDWTLGELIRADRPVVLLVGNHDCLDAGSVYHRLDLEPLADRIMLLDQPDGADVLVPGTDIVVWGRAMQEHAPSFRPVAGVPARRPDVWSVVAGHGIVEGVSAGFSSPIAIAELERLDTDYVALGHVHNHTVAWREPLTVYPGATGYSLAGEPGCVVVRFDVGAPRAEWVSLAERMVVDAH